MNRGARNITTPLLGAAAAIWLAGAVVYSALTLMRQPAPPEPIANQAKRPHQIWERETPGVAPVVQAPEGELVALAEVPWAFDASAPAAAEVGMAAVPWQRTAAERERSRISNAELPWVRDSGAPAKVRTPLSALPRFPVRNNVNKPAARDVKTAQTPWQRDAKAHAPADVRPAKLPELK